MNKELYVSATPHETRLALSEDGEVVEVYYEREKEYSLAGSIYKGRVTRVLPGMQSAFVDIGLERDAFLYVSDFFEDSEEYDRVVSEAEDAVARLETRPAASPARAVPETPRAERVERPEPATTSAESAEESTEAGDSGEDSLRRQRRGRRRGRRGRSGIPDTKFARPEDVLNEPADAEEELAEAASEEEAEAQTAFDTAAPKTASEAPAPAVHRPAAPVYQALILPGESLAKYRGVAPVPVPAPDLEATGPAAGPVAETASESVEAAAEALAEEFVPPISVPEWPAEAADSPEVERQAFEQERVQPDSPRERGRRRRGKAAPVPEAAVKESTETVPEREFAAGTAVEPAAETSGDGPAEANAPETAAESALAEMPETSATGADRVESAESADREIEAEEGDEEEAAESASLRHQPQQAHFEVRGKRRRRRRRNGPAGGEEPGANASTETAPVVAPIEVVPPHQSAARTPRLIGDLLHEGQEILVQIAKEPLGKKGARITSHLALPGRYLVYMPTVSHIGVSRKIASDEERARLKRLILENSKGLPGGFIVRTAGAGAAEEDFKADIRFLGNLWQEMRQQFERRKSPALLHHDLDLVERTLRDQLSDQFTHIWVDSPEQYQRVVRFVNYFMPHLTSRVRLYTREVPMFEHFGIQEEINKGLKSKVWLKSGGYIVINQTEALVAIDVNTGKYVGKSNRLEDTIFKTNLDAIREIVRQIRLRDLGGIIVIDFIDMDERRNRQKVMQALEEAMRIDRAPSKVLSFNDFGLVALTRKRVKQSLERSLGTACPYCAGVGLVKSVTTVCNEIFVEVKRISPTIDRDDLVLRVNPEVGKALKANSATRLNELEEITGKTISVQTDPLVHQEQFEIY